MFYLNSFLQLEPFLNIFCKKQIPSIVPSPTFPQTLHHRFLLKLSRCDTPKICLIPPAQGMVRPGCQTYLGHQRHWAGRGGRDSGLCELRSPRATGVWKEPFSVVQPGEAENSSPKSRQLRVFPAGSSPEGSPATAP